MKEEGVAEWRWISASDFFLHVVSFRSKSPFEIAPSNLLHRIIAKSDIGIRSLRCRITRFKGSSMGGFGQRGGFGVAGGQLSVSAILIHFGIGSVRSKNVLADICLIFVFRIRLPDLALGRVSFERVSSVLAVTVCAEAFSNAIHSRRVDRVRWSNLDSWSFIINRQDRRFCGNIMHD